MAPLTTIRNIGPAGAKALAKIGIDSAEALREIGADAAYLRMLQAGQRPHFIGYYVLVMGLQGRPWNDAQGGEKTALRTRFDALVAEARATAPERVDPSDTLMRALDDIGVRPRDPGS